jgi:hypothetical protein
LPVAVVVVVAAAVLEMMAVDLSPCSLSQLPHWQERFDHCYLHPPLLAP